MNTPFNPDMLRLARDLRGLTQKDLAERCGCKQAFVSHVEHGQKGVSSDRLSDFGRALGLPVEFFLQSGGYGGIGPSLVFYRKKQSTLKSHVYRLQAEVAIRKNALARFLREVEIEKTERSFRFMDVEDFDGRAEDIARLVRATWLLPAGPISNLISVIENAGGFVFRFSFGTRDVDAMSLWSSDLPPMFFVNEDAPADRVRFSLAHEMGHVIMHRDATDEMEREADRFAAEFLMPQRDISHDLVGMSVQRAAQLKPYWRTSMAALIRRSRTLGVIGDAEYARMLRTMSKHGYRKLEPVTIEPEEPRLLDSLLSVYRDATGASIDETARRVCLSGEDFRLRFCKAATGIRLAV